MTDLLNANNLQMLKSVGHHMAGRARQRGEDASQPLAFVGLMTMLIGATMLMRSTSSGRER